MIKNYFKIALRNLIKNKTYLIINSLGMGVAIACCMAAYLLIAFNIEFDSYYKEDNQDISIVVPAYYTTVCDSDGDGIIDNIEESQSMFGWLVGWLVGWLGWVGWLVVLY